VLLVEYYFGGQIGEAWERGGGKCSTHVGEVKCIQWLVGKPDEEDSSEDVDVDDRVILNWVLRKEDGLAWTDVPGSWQGQAAGCSEHRIELCVCKIRDFLGMSFWRRKFMLSRSCVFVTVFIAVIHQRPLWQVASNGMGLSRCTSFNRMKTGTDGGVMVE